MTLPRRLELPIDIGGLLVALVVDIVINIICFATLAPDMITRVAFVAIGVMTVLFVFRSWSKRQYIPWLVFMLVVAFFDYSFALVATKAQTERVTVNVYEDAEVKRLDGEIALHNMRINDLTAQYSKAAKRETMDQLNGQITDEKKARNAADADRKARIRELTRTNETSSGITSAEIFNAIPDAARDGRWIQLIVFGLIFAGLQLIIVTSIDAPRASTAPVAPPDYISTISYVPVTDEELATFVNTSWYRVEQRTDEHLLPRNVFFDYLEKRGVAYRTEVYETIEDAAKRACVISEDGTIIIKDKAEAIGKIKEWI